MEIKGKTVLITGATGFIGGRLAERLLAEESATVRALVRNLSKARRLQELGIEIAPGDITKPETLASAMQGCRIVFHCAAQLSQRATAEERWQINVEGTRNLLEAASQARVERFVHLSSVAVYGLEPKDGTNETFPPEPGQGDYSDAKIEAEKIAFEHFFTRKLPLTVIRPAHVYGPRSFHWTVRLIQQLQSNEIYLVGKGDGICSHVYIENLIDAIILATKNDEAVGEAFIITDGASTTWREFLGHYARMLGKDSVPTVPVSVARFVARIVAWSAKMRGERPGMSPKTVDRWINRAVFNINKARDQLGYRPRVTLEEGMRQTEAWLRQEGYI